MDFLSLPLSVVKGKLSRERDMKRSIDSNLATMIAAARFSCVADPDYGFVFNNYRFNIFNENEGVIFDSKPQKTLPTERNIYNLKLSGKSLNVNTFAAEISRVVASYEPRLSDVKASMTYVREQKLVYVTVNGVIAETGEEYTFTTTVKVWN